VSEGRISLPDMGFGKFSTIPMTSIIFPTTLTAIADDCFYSCTNLKTVTFTKEILSYTELSMGSTIFDLCSNLTQIRVPNNSLIEYKDSINLGDQYKQLMVGY
jgi:hypothetical protein